MAGPSGPAFLYNFYPRSPCGERQYTQPAGQTQNLISIHALLAESDPPADGLFFFSRRFLSTLSLRRATMQIVIVVMHALISIHALLAESDMQIVIVVMHALISIHALLAESDPEKSESLTTYLISIHALLAESDVPCWALYSSSRYFYPRSPCGERRRHYLGGLCRTSISIHALLAESDHIHAPNQRPYRYFYPRSPCGERPHA